MPAPRRQAIPRFQLRTAAQAGAFAFCAALVGLARGLPIAWLAYLAVLHGAAVEI